ncbi:hypothetical protein B0H14DRAFT_3852852 [Mycena olivaceomarginata]|nr:hypothetical protein B0H14DRAFT_3852852 [Mycena olivaceomarginata]
MSTINSAEDLLVDLQKGGRYTCDVPYIHFAAYSIPKFHLAAHAASCDWLTGLNHLCSDGESPERAWSTSNPSISSTKEMGPGKQHDFVAGDSSLWDRDLKNMVDVYQHNLFLSLDANIRLKHRPRDPVLNALIQNRQVKAKNAPGGPFPVIFSIDATFRITRLGPDGVEGVLSDGVELDGDDDEMPPLIDMDDDEDSTLELNAVDLTLKAKL